MLEFFFACLDRGQLLAEPTGMYSLRAVSRFPSLMLAGAIPSFICARHRKLSMLEVLKLLPIGFISIQLELAQPPTVHSLRPLSPVPGTTAPRYKTTRCSARPDKRLVSRCFSSVWLSPQVRGSCQQVKNALPVFFC